METYFAFFTAVFSGFSLYLVWRGFQLAKEYLPQHKEKLTIERNHRFAEKMIEIIYKIDSEMSELFKDKILERPEWQNDVKKVNELTDGFAILGYPQIRYLYMRHLAVKANKEITWGKVNSLSSELALYLGYFENRGMQFHKPRMIIAAKALIDWTVDTFPKLMREEFDTTKEFIDYFFSEINSKFPDTMYVKTPFVEGYEKHRDMLTEEVFKILEN
ncbi:hypothetical protein [Algoriphagus sp. Y33]|uniref:hypothetical protein n=1 Tax=Algoriphagus sp. Y33 TaxID=2772483 RepID=UPI0017822678|nr:hypothetical protein [Algoriphagus sp. Y33]